MFKGTTPLLPVVRRLFLWGDRHLTLGFHGTKGWYPVLDLGMDYGSSFTKIAPRITWGVGSGEVQKTFSGAPLPSVSKVRRGLLCEGGLSPPFRDLSLLALGSLRGVCDPALLRFLLNRNGSPLPLQRRKSLEDSSAW